MGGKRGGALIHQKGRRGTGITVVPCSYSEREGIPWDVPVGFQGEE